jgi:hypothetical protein
MEYSAGETGMIQVERDDGSGFSSPFCETTSMSLTPEEKAQRAERARRNGALGRGPGAESRGRTRLNALKGRLRAKTCPLPDEVEAEAARREEWHDWYDPRSPAARELADECARATIITERSDRFRRAELKRQRRNTQRNWERRRQRKVNAAVKRGYQDRLGSLAELASFAHGCRVLVQDFQAALRGLTSRGYLLPREIELATHDHGLMPDPATIATNVTAYTIHTLNLACTPGVAPEELEARLDPASRPAALRQLPRDQVIPADPRECARRLEELLKKRRDFYQAEADRLHREVDEPELIELFDRASILNEPAARKVKLSHAEARSTYHRAFKELYHTLDRDAEAGEEEAVEVRCPPHPGPPPAEEEAVVARCRPHPGPPPQGGREEEAGCANEPRNAPNASAQGDDSTEVSANKRRPDGRGPSEVSGVILPGRARPDYHLRE